MGFTMLRSGLGTGVAAVVLLLPALASGQTTTGGPPKSAMEAYEWVQKQRSEAGKLWSQGDPRGVEMLREALAYLERPPVRDMASGNLYLRARRENIWFDLAAAHAMAGDEKACFEVLRKIVDHSPSPVWVEPLRNGKHFEKVRGKPEFERILALLQQYSELWDGKAFKTPYQDNLPDAEKIAGLSRFWSEVKYNFGYPERLVMLEWDRLYMEWIPRVLATRTTPDYYRELMRLCALLYDGHTNVYMPAEADLRSAPPVRTGLVEGRLMVLEVMSRALEKLGLRAGMEILEIEGEPAIAWARRERMPFISASTPQDMDTRVFGYELLRGPKAKGVRLKLNDAANKTSDMLVLRQGWTDAKPRPMFEWRMTEGGIAVVELNGFDNSEPAKKWREAFADIAKAKAIVLDLRRNGGGNSGVGYEILRSLIDRPVLGSREVMRRYNPTGRARGLVLEWEENAAAEMTASEGDRYRGPVAVLAGAATYSAAEDFLVAWRNSARGRVFGEPSGGSTGQPLFFSLPGGGSARVCTKRDTFPDGREWVGKGIEPDVLVRTTVSDIRAGRDTVLEAALAALRKEVQ